MNTWSGATVVGKGEYEIEGMDQLAQVDGRRLDPM